MRSLFLKIFLAFFAAMALFGILSVATTMVIMHWEMAGNNLEVMGQGAVAAYLRGGTPELRRYFRSIEHDRYFRAILLDDKGNELSGRPFPRFLVPPETATDPDKLSKRRFPVRAITGPDGRRYVLMLLPPNRTRRWFFNAPTRLISTVLGLLATGLICYLLARYVTAPVARLRRASRLLASGDLSARAGGGDIRRRDEIGDLVRDFDAMAERLQDLVTAQRRLLSDISHELRSPLARLNVAVGLARRQAGTETQAALERIEIEADRLNEMLQNLLTLSRLESGDPGSMSTAVPLGSLVADVIADADFEAQAFERSVQAIASTDCTVLGNVTLLRSAIENVIRNAVRYTNENTAVEVSLTTENGKAIISVRDHGPGVPEESLPKLFRPFYRVDEARDRKTGGVGLGLSIAERAVRLHGGSVRARNAEPQGLVVELELPCSTDPARKPTTPAVTSETIA